MIRTPAIGKSMIIGTGYACVSAQPATVIGYKRRSKSDCIFCPDARDNSLPTSQFFRDAADGRTFVESHCLKGPTGFVSAVCSMPPSDQFPQGLILVGSHDCNIYCFNLESNSPLYKLLGHSGAVCSLTAGQFGTLVSGKPPHIFKEHLFLFHLKHCFH